MRIETLPVAVALSLAAATVQAQQAMDHSGHAGHDAPMQQMPMDHGQTDHGAMPGAPSDRASTSQESMDHGSHGSMTHPPATGIPPGEASRAPVPTIRDIDRTAAFPELPPHEMHRGGSNFLFLADQLEWQDADDGSALAWDISGWYGGDIDRLAFRSEGERTNGHTEEAELQLLWSHAIGPWWETVTGVRQDFKPGSPQTWAAFGVQGMPLFGLETEATAFLGEGGQSALRLEAEYDILLTQRWVLQPTAELNLHGRNDEVRGVGSGLSDANLGLRLRYEISRQFAPYVGVTWNRAYGNTADLLRDEDEDLSDTRLVAGVRFWF
ncbi:copper resistance protein B [Pseudomonadota bacterium DY0742]|uniref:copper resistance protein B n=1 Tax=Stutzerimonas balearica TaxID=74829 RepID=UPI001BC99CF5|nr:copper resistance protein B [Stutzerimonas balearica]MBS4150949.1 copper resistance protein B [Stutzerimonas balearica]MCZ4128755.1 copper resistance protein B [Stutzerimonas balearica]